MTKTELAALGHGKQPLLRVIRARCLDCCADQPSEVRKCTATRCVNWPYRMGTDPWRPEPTAAKREAGRQAMRRMHHPGIPGSQPSESADGGRAGPGDRAIREPA